MKNLNTKRNIQGLILTEIPKQYSEVEALYDNLNYYGMFYPLNFSEQCAVAEYSTLEVQLDLLHCRNMFGLNRLRQLKDCAVIDNMPKMESAINYSSFKDIIDYVWEHIACTSSDLFSALEDGFNVGEDRCTMYNKDFIYYYYGPKGELNSDGSYVNSRLYLTGSENRKFLLHETIKDEEHLDHWARFDCLNVIQLGVIKLLLSKFEVSTSTIVYNR